MTASAAVHLPAPEPGIRLDSPSGEWVVYADLNQPDAPGSRVDAYSDLLDAADALAYVEDPRCSVCGYPIPTWEDPGGERCPADPPEAHRPRDNP
jgi:hypothetical protein